MPATIAAPEKETEQKTRDGSGGRGRIFGDSHSGGGDSGRWGHYDPYGYGNSSQSSRLAMWLCMASITMLFAGLSSAYVFRLGLSSNVRSIPLPPELVWNTLVLLSSSVTLEFSRRSRQKSHQAAFRRWLSVTTILGLAFLLLQFQIWQQLAWQGIYLSSSPHASFFFLLTGAHGIHLFGGILGLMYSLSRAWFRGETANSGGTALEVTAMYWHFMAGLWVYLLLLLFFWRS
ncbi:MAG TPA: heme-copper oxidase subunit III [Terriglobia bacterium]|nr:heme-copper oxidase subunit III [Terriglobia bacterium]